MPAVSICIPTYNHAKFLEDSLHSAMTQTYTDVEIIVLDNASQDGTQAIVARAASHDSRIRYVRHPQNIGMIGNLNACVQFAQGKYIKLLCADDRLEPGCVSEMVRVLDQDPRVSLVACARTVADANLSALRIARTRTASTRISGEKMLSECFFFGNRIGEPTAVMFRRADSLQGFNGEYNQLVDLVMWFHLLCGGDFLAIPQTLCTIRSHAEQATQVNERSGRTVEDRRRLFREFAVLAGRTAGLFRKFIWDFRMAYAVARIAPIGDLSAGDSIREIFFPKAFDRIIYPMVKIMTILGLRLIWRTA